MKYLLGAILAFCLLGCQSQRLAEPVINFSIENESAHDLDWGTIHWATGEYSVGVLSIGNFATHVNMKWHFPPAGTLTFVDDKSRAPYHIDLSFAAINEQIRTGGLRVVTIRILDYDRAEVVNTYPRKSGR